MQEMYETITFGLEKDKIYEVVRFGSGNISLIQFKELVIIGNQGFLKYNSVISFRSEDDFKVSQPILTESIMAFQFINPIGTNEAQRKAIEEHRKEKEELQKKAEEIEKVNQELQEVAAEAENETV